jgi:hypothetical protein
MRGVRMSRKVAIVENTRSALPTWTTTVCIQMLNHMRKQNGLDEQGQGIAKGWDARGC